MKRQTIAGAFRDRARAHVARRRLVDAGVDARAIAMAPGAVAGGDDAPIDQPVTLVVVSADGDARGIREALTRSGGRIVAEVERRD